MKKNNLMPIAAAVFGLVLVFSQSAFKSESKQINYLFGKLANGVWFRINEIDDYICTSSNNSCKMLAPTQPPNGNNVNAMKGDLIYSPE